MTTDERTDVLVVGAGPTGLTVAGDVARAGHRVVVLEKWPTVNPSSRAFATMARTLEVLDARGLADDLLAGAHRAASVALFGGATLDLSHLPTHFPFAMITPQTRVDAALDGYARAQGADVRRGMEVVGIEQDADGVTVTYRPKDASDAPGAPGAPGAMRTIRAAWVVGADGAHSTVRRHLGAAFPGRTVLSSVILADVELDDGPSSGGLTVGSTPDTFGFLAPYGSPGVESSRFRAMVWDRRHQVPDSASVDDTEIADLLRVSMRVDHHLRRVTWKSRFHCDERQVEQYRHGRVFLAGDAAHVHSPVGGQGMNTGIQDGADLGWKLAAVLDGADPTLLDSYHAERHPIGERVLLQSGLMMRAITVHARVARRVRDAVAPRMLGIGPVRAAISGSFAGTGLRYRRRPGEHRLVGTSAGSLAVRGETVATLQRDGRFLLALGEHAPSVTPEATVDVARRTSPGPSVLLRPDGVVCWAGDETHDAGWRAALARWGGTSRRRVTSPGR